MKGFTLGLALKQRRKATRKSPIEFDTTLAQRLNWALDVMVVAGRGNWGETRTDKTRENWELYGFLLFLISLSPCVPGERPFKCPFTNCNRRFTTSNIRKVHMRTHTGERPYVCEHEGCGRSFASATNFKNHSRIHTGMYIVDMADGDVLFVRYLVTF